MSVMRFTPSIESKPIREIAYETLKHAIITGQIPAGVRIVETEYADILHISRTPLREALRKLERDGLVEYVLRRGVIVRAFTIADVEEIYTIRNALEMITLPTIISNATPEDIRSMREKLRQMDAYIARNDIDGVSPLARSFHDQLTAISGLNRILRVIQSQDEYIRRFSAMSIARETRRTTAHAEHYKLVDYVEQKDLESFTLLMQKHIERSKETCLIALEEAHYQQEQK
ncbi:MAG: GntR family transcriptional regulator [Eubacteriales bacterium]|nr:GntR family transcriptional regulator [Eubacteriales bacterium]